MTSRQRNSSSSSTTSIDITSPGESPSTPITPHGESRSTRSRRNGKRSTASRKMRRRHLVETLEARQLLAGPQLIGIQPNEGQLIDVRDDQGGIINDSNQISVLELSPRVMTFRFDDNQQLDPDTLGAVQFLRAGDDSQLGTDDDVVITPGLVTLGDPNENEIVVRFAETLPDDDYRINIFGFDDPNTGIVGLRNLDGELIDPSNPGQRNEVIDFRLDLGALIESVVPQPVVRNADGTLTQNRNEVVVYFNEDPLFTENDSVGNPTPRSAENPRFYQLILTNDTVNTQDDEVYEPVSVVYDADTFTARLFFETDINELPGVSVGGGTFRLRIGSAVETGADLKLQPNELLPTPSVAIDLDGPDNRLIFQSKLIGENQPTTTVLFTNTGVGGLQLSIVGGELQINFGGIVPLASDIQAAVNSNLITRDLFEVRIEGSTTQPLPQRLLSGESFELVGLGDTFTTATDLGVVGNSGALQSFLISDSISAQTTSIVLPGSNEDPGSRDIDTELFRNLNPDFIPNAGIGITEIPYNFTGVLATVDGTSFLNQITERQKTRIRETLDLWSNRIGVQFRETLTEGITFGVGDSNRLEASATTTVRSIGVLDASLRIDPTFEASALVFNNQVTFNTAYGEDFTRKSAAGIGLLLGLEFAPELPPESLLTGTSQFLEDPIDPVLPGDLTDLEPVFPGNQDVLHGQYLYQPDSVDVDLYRFEVNLDDADRVGTLTVETFAERLADSSLLDTTVRLFEEVNASVTTDFNVGPTLQVQFTAVDVGRLGNRIQMQFVESDRAAGETEIRVLRVTGDDGQLLDNVILLDIPRLGRNISSVPVSDLINAINSDPFASELMRAELVTGDASTDIANQSELILRAPLELTGGGLLQLARNDDYFSEDSFLSASLGQGVYYIGVSASGNDTYDPEIPDSAFGGVTQGDYEVLVKFDPNVDEENVLRDRDGLGNNLPGTPIDGDGDGRPGGVNQFWFQTRPEDRILQFDLEGAAITPNQTIRIVGGSGVIRTYEFVPLGGSRLTPGSNQVTYNATPGTSAPPESLANALVTAIQLTSSITGVTAEVTGPGNQIRLLGERSVELSTNTRGLTVHGKTIFVDKTGPTQASGSLDSPINNIASRTELSAFSIALPGDQVRIVGNGGDDGLLETEDDNYSYQFGAREIGGGLNEDGANMEVPQGVTTLIDAGAILKFRSARIGVGSSSLQIDRSGSLLQVLGTPRLVQLSTGDNPTLPGFDPTVTLIGNTEVPGGYQDGSVILTSMRDRLADADAAGFSPAARPGDWGGIVFRSDFDRDQGRFSLEDEGIFVDRVNHSEIRFGGGSNVLIDSQQQLVNPITMFSRRPTISFNEITRSADAAISASPDTFEETTFQSPIFQAAGTFIADYSRSGPDVYSNTLVDNSINGMFVRITTTGSEAPRQLNVSGRFDDTDVVHHLAENLIIAGTPGGSSNDGIRPELTSSSGAILQGGNLVPGDYQYRMTFVDEFGFESQPSDPSGVFTIPTSTTGEQFSIELRNLPAIGGVSNFVSRRIYRLVPGTTDEYVFVARLDSASQTFVDNGSRNITNSSLLDPSLNGVRGRLDASLTIDPGLVIKLNGSRIELGHGTQLLAEGTAQLPIVMTSLLDDRYGAGGTFNTNNDNDVIGNISLPERGDWSGIYAGPDAHVGLDNAVVAYGGGISTLAGGLTRGYVPLQLQQASGRIVDSRFEFNQSGQDGAGPVGRFGAPGVTPSVIHVRGSQPTIVGNEFVDNRGSVIDIDSNSFNAERIVDLGRETGLIDRLVDLDDNYGPLIRDNSYRIIASQAGAQQQFSGMEIRGGELTTESIWDDTDIVHILFDSIEVGNFHSSGGLRLISRAEESLVVKFSGGGNPFSPTSGTGLTANGSVGDIEDRIGGTVQVIGMPGSPVILTSFQDDTVGGGLELDGTPFTDTNGDSYGSRPESNDWRSVLFDQYSNVTNMEFILERELASELSPGLNGSFTNAQTLGILSANPIASDAEQRIGFEVEGFLSQANDVDTYAFTAEAGTQVWIDVDSTSFTLDTVIEVLDPDGTVIARSDNSSDEVAGLATVDELTPSVAGLVGSLQRDGDIDDFYDFNSVNPRDAGLRMTLPGPIGAQSTFLVRIRSAALNPDDAAGGLTRGGYRFQLRTQEDQLFSGSFVRFADIRYANHGIHIRGGNSNSPLLGDAQENELLGNTSSNDIAVTSLDTPGQRAQYLGNLLQSRDGSFSVGGQLSSLADVDHYQIDVDGTLNANGGSTVVFDIDYADGFNRPDTMLSLFYDPDGETGDAQPRLVAVGNDSNILEDQGLVNGGAQDLLSRGSIDDGDAYIGPLTLPGGSGTYYIAVSGEGTVPEALGDALVRLEPVDSVIRIFDDQVNTTLQTTALPQREDGPFINTNLLPFGWTVTTDRATDVGHNQRQTFNGSRPVDLFPDSIQFESETNNSFLFADSLETLEGWSLNDDPNVGNTFGTNTSQLFPHTKAFGSTINEIVDVFQFEVTDINSTVILDIDAGFNPSIFTENPGLAGLDVGNRDIADLASDSVDLKLQLFDISGTLLASNSFSVSDDGALGSVANPFSFFTNDPYLERTLQPGQYFVAVSPEATEFDPDTGIFNLDVAERPQSGTYELNVSVQGHPTSGGDPDNESLHFDRSEFRGDLDSEPFDLVGYSDADQPTLYFDYLLRDAGADAVRVTVRSDQQPDEVVVIGNAAGIGVNDAQLFLTNQVDSWFQSRIDLGDFAGDTGVTVQFQYDTDFGVGAGTAFDGDGLYIDNFIVGFAERGELVTGASSGRIGFSGASESVTGEYQLEIRPGESYRDNGLVRPADIATSFDTNASLSRSMSLVAPLPGQIVDGNTFSLSDNVREVTFEFNLTGGVTPGNIPIDISTAVTRADVALAITQAINLPAVQALVQINASDTSGSTDGSSSDVRIALSGLVSGDFFAVDNVASVPQVDAPLAPDGGTLPIAAIFTNLIGDSNVVRTQDQVIVDSNTISDVHAIGIYSEPGDRGVDPQDIKFPPADGVVQGNFFGFNTGNVNVQERFLQQPPIGSTTPGAVRNLPTLNDSVVGGLAPGISIVNNTIDSAGYAGIKVDGDLRPWVIDSSVVSGDFLFATNFGDLINDGLTFTIDAAGTRVTFEFEEINGPPTPTGGSGVAGGDGFVDGHVPIHYRHTWIGAYNGRLPGSTRHEVMIAIYEAILGSILVTNDLVQLVKPTVGPSIIAGNETEENRYLSEVSFPSASLYLEGVSGIYVSSSFQKFGGGNPFNIGQAAVGEAAQPFAQIVNNTIYGQDGTESTFTEQAITVQADGDDTLDGALRTQVGQAHASTYLTTGTIGNGNPVNSPAQDIDIYEVELLVGDRLIVDVDTLPNVGPDTFLQLFDARGVVVAANSEGLSPDHLELSDIPAEFDLAIGNTVDPFLDVTVTEAGTYFVAVSSQGNEGYDPNSISGRTLGTGGLGEYDISIDALAARNFVLSVDNQNQARNGNNTGTTGADLADSSITITQVADRSDPLAVPGETNSIRFEFNVVNTAGLGAAGIQNINGETVVTIDVQTGSGYRVPEILNAIEDAINGRFTVPPLPNHELGNGPIDDDIGVLSGPITQVGATALGGIGGNGTGSRAFGPVPSICTGVLCGGIDYQFGFGHDRLASIGSTQNGTTELYLLIEDAADVTVTGNFFRLDPADGRNIDQLLPEKGIMMAGGSSGVVFNNVFSNLHTSINNEETRLRGFNSPDPDEHPKKGELVVTSNAFQHDDPTNSVFRDNINSINNGTGIVQSPSNVNGGTDDFNVILGNNDPLFVHAAGNDFLPELRSEIIDTAATSVQERDRYGAVKQSVGLPINNILAPLRDGSGVLRADNDAVAPPSGLGGSLFLDLGANERADFNGPVAIILNPLDNDAAGLDADGNDTFIDRPVGGLSEFVIQIRDTGDSSDPFTGVGVDSDTVLVAEIPGLRKAGDNVTVFENDRLLIEGIDYRVRFDDVSDNLFITPIAGIWRDDRSYRIVLNNRDRSVLVAPSPDEVSDGDQVRITDSDGGTVVFEFETGYQLSLPEPLTLVVPNLGTDVGGIRDGDIFQISDGINEPVVFEFDADGVVLPGSLSIALPAGPTPLDPDTKDAFLQGIGDSIRDAITLPRTDINGNVIPAPFDFDVSVVRDPALPGADGETPDNIETYRVVLGAPAGVTVDTSAAGLAQSTETLTLAIPAIGGGVGGVADGDTITISDGNIAQTFEFTTDGQVDNANAIDINVTGLFINLNGVELAEAIAQAIIDSPLGITPTAEGTFVFLNLPDTGSVTTSAGQTQVVGVSRPINDGDIIRLSRPAEAPSRALEINGFYPAGLAVDNAGVDIDAVSFTLQLREGDNLPEQFRFEFDTSNENPAAVTPGSIAIDVTETITPEGGVPTEFYISRDELTRRIAAAMLSRGIDLNPISQDEFVFITVPDGQEIVLESEFPGIGLTQQAQFVQRQTLEFHLRSDADPNGADVTPGHIPVVYELTDTAIELAERVSAILNATAVSVDEQELSVLLLQISAAESASEDAQGVTNSERFQQSLATVFEGQDIPVNPDSNEVISLLPGLLDTSQRTAPGQVAVGVDVNNPVLLTVTEGSSLSFQGEPGVSGSSTVQVFGPLLLNVPTLGGVSIINGSILVLTDLDGSDVVFQFALTGIAGTVLFPGATLIPYGTNDSATVIATALADAINNSAAGIPATIVDDTQVSLGRIAASRVSNTGRPGFSGATAISVQRGIVSDGEILRIRQGDISVSFEFDSVESGGGVQPGNIQVSFQPNSSPGDIAESLVAAIRNNNGGLRFTPGLDGTIFPIAETDENGELTGAVILNDLPGTQVDTSEAPTLNVTGVPGGAIPITISPLFSPETVKQVILSSLNNVNRIGEDPTTTLLAEDRGGSSLFLDNALVIEGPIDNYLLPAIKDEVGNNLEPNRDDQTTQFTINLSDIALDYGDAPDPVGLIPGRYPTRLKDNGARHVIGTGPVLGRTVDAEADALSVRTADGDDLTIVVSGGGGLFANRLEDGVVKIDINPTDAFNVLPFDGETITIDTGPRVATFEFDTDGIFNEDNIAIWVPGYQGDRVLTASDLGLLSDENIARGIEIAIQGSVINPADVRTLTDASSGDVTVEVSGDDEDGVIFTSAQNPLGTFNPSPGSVTPIEVTVNVLDGGSAVLEAWIDFNADGDWDDPGELVISPTLPVPNGVENPAIFGPGETVRDYDITIPSTTQTSTSDTYARFRVSRTGTGSPVGLALSGEVEDYLIRVVDGTPPTIADTTLNYTVNEGGFLQASDDIGIDTFLNNDGLLVGVQGEINPLTNARRPVVIFAEDVGSRDLFGADGQLAGTLNISSNGTFTFVATDDFTGDATFDVLVTDLRPDAPGDQLVSNERITATISVAPVNDRPTLADNIVPSDVLVTRTINEDNVTSQADQTSLGPVVFTASELIDPFFVAGPGDEVNEQFLVFSTAGFAGNSFRTEQGGTLSIGNSGLTILYTPPENFNGITANGVEPDVFNYQVADRLLPNLPGNIVSQTAITSGRVEIVFNGINDNPTVVNESYQTQEDQPITIPVFGPRTIDGVVRNGLLDNDAPGPQDEFDANQTISLKPNQFTSIQNGVLVQERRTLAGGTIRQVGDDLIYTPMTNFSGTDRFDYIVVDSLGAEETGTATIAVGDVNKAPTFVGIRGVAGVSNLEFTERKQAGETDTFDLNSWFNDPDGDVLTFTIDPVSDTSLIQPDVSGDDLIIDFTPFAFGQTNFTVRATDPDGLTVPRIITVDVQGTADAPTVVGSFNPTRILEGSVFVGDLKREPGENSGLFLDRDTDDTLTYSVNRLGNLTNPSTAEIANHPLIQRIEFIGDSVRIVPQPFASGSVQIEIEAFDGLFVNSHTFDFIIDPVATTPIGNFSGDDAYNVPLGGTLRITDPSLGLLRNDFDPDDNSIIRVDPNSLTQPVGGTGTVSLIGRDDGAFSFTTVGAVNRPVAGQSDTFTYRIIDDTGRLSEPVTVTLTYSDSNFQNPIDQFDVTADGFVTAVDVLRVINLLNSNGGPLNVSEIETSPPDYYDVNGDGSITPLDVLQIINTLNSRDVDGNNGSSEPLSLADYGVSVTAGAETFAPNSVTGNQLRSLASTRTYANVSSSNLGSANQIRKVSGTSPRESLDPVSSLDTILTGGIELDSGQAGRAEETAGRLASELGSAQSSDSAASGEVFDSALEDLFSDLS